MKKKLLSFLFAICLILPLGFVFSGCSNTEDPNNPNTTLSTVQKDFGKAMNKIKTKFNDATDFFEKSQNSNIINIEYSLVDSWATMYTMTSNNSEVSVKNSQTGDILSLRNIEAEASLFEITEESIEKAINTVYSSEFAYFNGYLVNLTTGQWEAVAYESYEKDMLIFLEDYLDLYNGSSLVNYSTTTQILNLGPSANGKDIFCIKI